MMDQLNTIPTRTIKITLSNCMEEEVSFSFSKYKAFSTKLSVQSLQYKAFSTKPSVLYDSRIDYDGLHPVTILFMFSSSGHCILGGLQSRCIGIGFFSPVHGCRYLNSSHYPFLALRPCCLYHLMQKLILRRLEDGLMEYLLL